MKYKTMLIISAVLFSACCALNAVISAPFYMMSAVEFRNLDNYSLSARVSKSANGKGVLIAGDLGRDKGGLCVLAGELASRGYGVFVFDFPSVGNSESFIPFSYKEKVYMAEQFYCALVAYSQLEGMPPEDIYIVGYGEGARAVLQTMALENIQKAAGVILVACDINLTGRADFDILNFSKDNELEWVKGLTRQTPPYPDTPVLLITSNMSGSSSPADNEALLTLLNRSRAGAQEDDAGRPLSSLVTLRWIAGPSMMSSPTAAGAVLSAITGHAESPAFLNRLRTPLLGASYALFAAILYLCARMISVPMIIPAATGRKKPSMMIRAKLFMAVPAMVAGVMAVLLLYTIQLPFPYRDVLMAVLTASYGITALLMYKFTTFASNLGSVLLARETTVSRKRAVTAVALIYLGLAAVNASASLNIFTLANKWVWLVLFFVMLIPLFYVDEKERRIFTGQTRTRVLLFLCNYAVVIASPVVLACVGMLDSVPPVLSLAVNLMVAMSSELYLRTCGASSFFTACAKSFLFVSLSYTHMTLFF